MSTATAPAERAQRNRQDKYDERRIQLAESALATLGELGYARTSLREIAQNSPFSHGVVHYYFKDKTALILYCVRHYKQQCVTRYDEVVRTAGTAEELRVGFADKLVETLCAEAAMHRLWYDLRGQALFDPALRPDVSAIDEGLRDMIDRVLVRYADLASGSLRHDATTNYALLDGVFQAALLSHLVETDDSLEPVPSEATRRLHDQACALLPELLTTH